MHTVQLMITICSMIFDRFSSRSSLLPNMLVTRSAGVNLQYFDHVMTIGTKVH